MAFDLPPPECRSGGEARNTLVIGETGRPAIPFPCASMPWSQCCKPRARASRIKSAAGSRPIDVAGAGAQEQCPMCWIGLAPALRGPGAAMEVPARLVEDLVELCNWLHVGCLSLPPIMARRASSEGFGLRPLEALACGCVVFQSASTMPC